MTNPDSPPRTCSQGHTVPEERDDCPVCGETFAGTESQPGRSLWDVMGQNSTPTQPDTVDPGEAEDDGTPPDSTDRDDTDEEAEEAPRPKGLWSMMEPNRDDAPSETIVSTAQLPEIEPVELAEAVDDDDRTDWEVSDGEKPDGEKQPEWDEDTDSDNGEPGSPRSRSCRTSLVLGIAALLLAGLGLVPPTFWTSLPALVAGLVAVYTGLVGTGETGTTSGEHLRGRGEAMAGISLGTLGMFLPRLLQMWL